MNQFSFAAEVSAESKGGEDLVVYQGKVFEAGEYPDKDFAIDEAELSAKVEAFQGVDLDLEHSSFKDILGNKLGRLDAVWRRGSDAIGRLRIPRWLHELAGGRLQTSLSFDADKNIVGCALTLSPRISDAQVVAAFSNAASGYPSPPAPSPITNQIGEGVLIDARSPITNQIWGRESSPHPLTPSPITNQMGEGVPCDPLPPGSASLHSPSAGLGSITNQMGEGVLIEKEKYVMSRSFKERLRVLFRLAPEALGEAGIEPNELDAVEFTQLRQTPAAIEQSATDQPKIDPAIQAQLAEFKATNDRLIAGQLQTAATLFADEVIRSAKAVPAQKEQLIALFRAAAIADGAGVVKFSESGAIAEGANMAALRELFKNAQPHSLFNTQIPNADPNDDANAPDAAMVERLRNATSLGKRTKEGK